MFEKFKNQKPELPTGEAQKLNKAFQENLLLFSEVKNKVAFVNDEIMTPLKLKEGKSSPLGLFAKAALPEKFEGEISSGEQRLEVWSEHNRSALLSRIIFKDKEGRLYRDIDLKGIGYIWRGEIKDLGGGLKDLGGSSKLGLLNSDTAFFDCQLSEEFLRAGIRTHRVLAIIDLEELIVNGKKISLEEAKKRNIINKEFQPVVEVRAFATKARITEMRGYQYKTEETPKKVIADAKKLVSQELGRGDNPLSDEEYLEWFARILGKNVGLLHKNGWCHDYLSGHNITLDCRIVDLDSVTELSNQGDQNRDINDAKTSLLNLVNYLEFSGQYNFYDQFLESYNAVFPSEEREKYFARKKKEQAQEEG